jgi:hypothetical protein
VRSQDWKLTEAGELFDMKDAPFIEKPVSADTMNPNARAGRDKLQKVLDTLKPARETRRTRSRQARVQPS